MVRIILALSLALFSALAQTNVNVGNSSNDGQGDSLRLAMQKLNYFDNFNKTNIATVSNSVVSLGTNAFTVIRPNGTNDMSAVIQAAINTNSYAFLGEGEFYITNQIILTNNQTIVGSGMANISTNGTRLIRRMGTTTNATIKISGQHSGVNDVSMFVYDTTIDTNGAGLWIVSTPRSKMQNVAVFSHRNAMQIQDSFHIVFQNFNSYNIYSDGIDIGPANTSCSKLIFQGGQLYGRDGATVSGTRGIKVGSRVANNIFQMDVEFFDHAVEDNGSNNEWDIYTENVGSKAFSGSPDNVFINHFHDATRTVDFSSATNLTTRNRGRGYGRYFDWQNQIVIPQPLAEYDFAFMASVDGSRIQSLWPGAYDITWTGSPTHGSDGLMGRKYVQAVYPGNYLIPPTNLFNLAGGPRTFIICFQTSGTAQFNNNILTWHDGTLVNRHGLLYDNTGSGLRTIRTIASGTYNINQSGARVTDGRWSWLAVVLNGANNTAKMVDIVTGTTQANWTNTAVGVSAALMPYRPSGTITVRYSYFGVWDSELSQTQIDSIINERELGALRYEQEFSRQLRRAQTATEAFAVLHPPITSDPVGAGNGQTWYRSDLGRLRVRMGGTNYSIAVE